MVFSSMTTLAVSSDTFLCSVFSSMWASRSIFAISAKTVRFCGEAVVVDSSTLQIARALRIVASGNNSMS
jgi:hypothetical protein